MRLARAYAHGVRWWLFARGAVFLWLAGLLAWSTLTRPNVVEEVAVAAAAAILLTVALLPSAPWWRGRTGLEHLSSEQRRSLARRDWLWFGLMFVLVVAASVLFGTFGRSHP